MVCKTVKHNWYSLKVHFKTNFLAFFILFFQDFLQFYRILSAQRKLFKFSPSKPKFPMPPWSRKLGKNISKTIREGRWKLFGHIFRRKRTTSANMTMKFCFIKKCKRLLRKAHHNSSEVN